jgi:hypothetical protein
MVRHYFHLRALKGLRIEFDHKPLKPGEKSRFRFVLPGSYHIDKAEIRFVCFREPLVGDMVRMDSIEETTRNDFIDREIRGGILDIEKKYREVVHNDVVLRAEDISSGPEKTINLYAEIEVPLDAAGSRENKVCRTFWSVRVILQEIASTGNNRGSLGREDMAFSFPVRVESPRDVTLAGMSLSRHQVRASETCCR